MAERLFGALWRQEALASKSRSQPPVAEASSGDAPPPVRGPQLPGAFITIVSGTEALWSACGCLVLP
ncbi:hypothetical protein CapIbe_021058 [Capra ibex]